MRISVGPPPRVWDADHLEHADRVFSRFGLCVAQVEPGDLHELVRDPQERIERRHRVLKNHRDALAANSAHFLFGQFQEVAAAEQHFAAGYASGRRRDQPHDRQVGDRLAGTGFADDSERLTALEVERDVVHCLDDSTVFVEVRAKVVDREESGALH